jgi:DNA-directed RNA polymerase specialized sigma24 family protein
MSVSSSGQERVLTQARDFEEFYAASYGKVTALVAAVLGDRDEADDVTQEAFARALAPLAPAERL